MKPTIPVATLLAVLIHGPAMADTPCTTVSSVALETSGLDIEAALGALRSDPKSEVAFADTVAPVGPDVLVALARRCAGSACEVVAARFHLAPLGPKLTASRILLSAGSVGTDLQLGAVRGLGLACPDVARVALTWVDRGATTTRTLRPDDLGVPTGPLLLELVLEGGAPGPLLTIAATGAWSASKVAAGRLTADELKQLTAAIDAATLTATRGPPCPGTPGYTALRTARSEVRWSTSGCGLVPHASVLALVQLAESLTTRRPSPTLVKLSRWRVGEQDRAESVALMRTGAWTTHHGRGTLPAPVLAEIIAALDAALIEAPPIPEAEFCKGDFVHRLEVPGRGELHFVWPCHKPSPTLQVALDRLYAAVGLRAP